MSIAVINSGGANLGSVTHALRRLGVDSRLTQDAAEIRSASHVILPGVGAAGSAMRALREAGLVEVIRSLTQPVLGICLGLQLLHEYSSEGETECLGIIPGRVERMAGGAGLRLPHMGWSQLHWDQW
jgi:imidazole glycerol-phosphate synthase subunit HisH